MQLSDRVQHIAESQSLQMAARARRMKAEGIDIISMSLGEPDMDTPEHIRRAAQEAVDNHWSHYGPVPGIPSLRTAIAEWHNSQSPIVFSADDVLVSVGAKQAIYNAIQTLVNPGDEVVIPMPAWVSYTEMVKLAQGVVVPVRTRYEDNYCLTPEQLRAALTPRTRMLILCSPNNPTGSLYSYSQLSALVSVLRDYPEVTVLSDEVYNQLVYPPAPSPGFAAFPELADRLVVVNAVSKAYAMTGYRVGWLLSKNRDFIAACIRLQGQQVTCATVIAQKAAEAALTGPQDCVEQLRQVFDRRRRLICGMAAEIPGFRFREPQGAFYLFPDVSALFGKRAPVTHSQRPITDATDVAEYLLNEAHVAVVSGSAFGEPDCIRLSYAISTDLLSEAMSRIRSAVEKLL